MCSEIFAKPQQFTREEPELELLKPGRIPGNASGRTWVWRDKKNRLGAYDNEEN